MFPTMSNICGTKLRGTSSLILAAAAAPCKAATGTGNLSVAIAISRIKTKLSKHQFSVHSFWQKHQHVKSSSSIVHPRVPTTSSFCFRTFTSTASSSSSVPSPHTIPPPAQEETAVATSANSDAAVAVAAASAGGHTAISSIDSNHTRAPSSSNDAANEDIAKYKQQIAAYKKELDELQVKVSVFGLWATGALLVFVLKSSATMSTVDCVLVAGACLFLLTMVSFQQIVSLLIGYGIGTCILRSIPDTENKASRTDSRDEVRDRKQGNQRE